MSGVEWFKKSRPIKIIANPIITLPQLLRLGFLENSKGKLNPTRGRTIIDIFILNPSVDISHDVTVVPIFDPIITPMDSPNVISPAFTKLTNITVVADDDWIIAVIATPVRIPLNRLDVIADKMFLNLSPATFCNDSLISFIPKRNNPREPNSFKKSNIEYCILYNIIRIRKSIDVVKLTIT